MYQAPSIVIATVLLLSMVVAIEIGHRVGLRVKTPASEAFKGHVNATSSSILGILALLLGFTFSLSLQRFDSRSEAVVDEANAIGTTYLRAQLLPESHRANVLALLGRYLDLRVQESSQSLVDENQRQVLLAQATAAQTQLWAYAREAAQQNPNPVTVGLFVQALNEMIDSFGRRDAGLNRHVPEVVLLLLYGTFLMAGAIVGYASGVSGHRPSFVMYIMVVLIVVLVFIILDLDRPRRGLIQVSQQSLFDLRLSVQAEIDRRHK